MRRRNITTMFAGGTRRTAKEEKKRMTHDTMVRSASASLVRKKERGVEGRGTIPKESGSVKKR